jgi:hypothetical protein
MAVAGRHAPFMASVTATNTAQSLAALMLAVYRDFASIGHACYIQLQLDVSAAGATLYIGNSNVASNMCGAALSAGQINQQFASDSNLLIPSDIFLLASTSSVQVNVIILKR